MGPYQKCPSCGFVNKIAGLYQTSFGNDRGGAQPPIVTCGSCDNTFPAKQQQQSDGGGQFTGAAADPRAEGVGQNA